MSLPDRETIKIALLNYLKDGQIHRSDEIENRLISHFGLTAEDLSIVIGTGRTKFGNDLDWQRYISGKNVLR